MNGTLTSGRTAGVVATNELRILRRDPVPIVLLFVMPLLLVVVLNPSAAALLGAAGHPGTPGSAQTIPGMATMFGTFAVAILGFTIFREHGWRTWERLEAAPLAPAGVVAGKVAVPTGLLLAQHLALFTIGALAFDLPLGRAWTGVAAVAVSFTAFVVAAGLAVTALAQTVQQMNALVNTAALALASLGGALVPVSMLPDWLQAAAPLSPLYWALRGYRAVLVEGRGLAAVVPSVLVLLGGAACCVAVAAARWGGRKATWG